MNIAVAGFLIGIFIAALFTSLAAFFLKTNKLISAIITAFPTKILSILIILLIYTKSNNIKQEFAEFSLHLYRVLILLGILFFIIHFILTRKYFSS